MPNNAYAGCWSIFSYKPRHIPNGLVQQEPAHLPRTDSNARNVATQMLADQSTGLLHRARTFLRYGLGQESGNAYAAVKLPGAFWSGRASASSSGETFDQLRQPQPSSTSSTASTSPASQTPSTSTSSQTSASSTSQGMSCGTPSSDSGLAILSGKFAPVLQGLASLPGPAPTCQTGEKQYDLSKAEEELEADFMGDSLDRLGFWQLADASPTKFRALAQVRMWLRCQPHQGIRFNQRSHGREGTGRATL